MRVPDNSAFDRAAGSHSLAAAGQRERYAEREGGQYRCLISPGSKLTAAQQ